MCIGLDAEESPCTQWCAAPADSVEQDQVLATVAGSQPASCSQTQRLQAIGYHPVPLLLGGVRGSSGVRDHLANVLCLRSSATSICSAIKTYGA